MSDPVAIALITAAATAIPLILTQVIGFIVSIRRTDEVRETLKITDGKVEKRTEEIKEDLKTAKEDIKTIASEQSQKLDDIHQQTNSNLTEQKKMVQDLTNEVKALRTERDVKAGAEEGKAAAESKAAKEKPNE